MADSPNQTLLIIRLGAMGDILHALPAVASLKRSFPSRSLVWLVSPKWKSLLAGNPYVDELTLFERSGISLLRSAWRALHLLRPAVAIDFQGLLQSALAGRLARPERYFGFDRSVAREPLASMLYTHRIHVTGPHRIERNLQLASAAGATVLTKESWIPAGAPEGVLPAGPFVLASPFAGWESKQWPIELYDGLGKRLSRQGLELVVNVVPERAELFRCCRYLTVHCSSLEGLIYATRRATAIVGVDSGPLHLAAALKKPGVALFGPTDPAQTGPFESPIQVLRRDSVKTTYKRGRHVDPSLAAIPVEQVADALLQSIADARDTATEVLKTT